MRCTTAIALISTGLIGLTAPLAHGDVEQQLLSYDWNQTLPSPTITFDAFDPQDGTRDLKDVRFRVDGLVTVRAYAENLGKDPVTGWTLDLSAQTHLEFLWDDEFGINVGGASFPTLTADLAGTDGVEGSGDDYVKFDSMSTKIASFNDIPSERIDDFIGTGELSAVMLFIPSAGVGPGQVTFGLNEFEQSGALYVEYTYNEIPAPAGLALFAGLAATARRRRR